MFGGDSLRLQIILSAIDRATEPVRRISTAVGRIGKYTAAVGVVGAGLGVAFGKSLLDTAAQFEKFESILVTTEGSAEKARASMAWVSEFATKTPFEIAEVTEAFVRLRAYGMDPTDGLLQTLGDTSSAMGKSLMQGVEAIADAVTGENERLNEFGIKARAAGKQIVYEYTANGKTMTKAADKSNRQQIQSVLAGIWNEKYGGAMDKMRGNWSFMVAEISDQWARFQLLIMEGGLFEALKGKLRGVLDTINQLAASGRLKEIAAEVGTKMVDGFTKLWDVMTGVASALGTLADLLGGWQNLALAVAAIPLVAPVVALIGALSSLAVAIAPVGFAFTPVLLAVAAIGAAAYLIIANWDTLVAFFTGVLTAIQALLGTLGTAIQGFFSGIFDGIVAGIDSVLGKIGSVASAVTSMLPSFVTDAFAPKVDLANAPKFEPVVPPAGTEARPGAGKAVAQIAGLAEPPRSEPGAAPAGNQPAKSIVGQIAGIGEASKAEPVGAGNQPGAGKAGLGRQIAGIAEAPKLGPPAPSLAGGVSKTEVGGTIKVQIDSEGRPRVKEIKSSNRNVDLRANTGLVMATP